ncbi:MAG: hypothetical protein HUU60_10665 [Armatimonadetes bacterium]|nr:hypothetical protein [Armatimonadota bacterium]
MKSIIGHAAIVDQLLSSLAGESPPSALMLAGDESLGKYTLALTYAGAWLCLSNVKPCYECESCAKLFGTGETPLPRNLQFALTDGPTNHPDVLIVAPSPDQIKIEQTRNARQWASFHAVMGRGRFIIIKRAQMMNLSAANALLKTLEEPPPGYTFLLTADSTDGMLPTILSRCRIIRLGPLTANEIANGLTALIGTDPERAMRLGSLARGRVGRAIRWAISDESPSLSAMEELDQIVMEGLSGRPIGALLRAERFRAACAGFEAETGGSRQAIARGFEFVAERLRDALEERLIEGRHEGADRLKRLIAEAMAAKAAALGNANAQISSERLFVEMALAR